MTRSKFPRQDKIEPIWIDYLILIAISTLLMLGAWKVVEILRSFL